MLGDDGGAISGKPVNRPTGKVENPFTLAGVRYTEAASAADMDRPARTVTARMLFRFFLRVQFMVDSPTTFIFEGLRSPV